MSSNSSSNVQENHRARLSQNTRFLSPCNAVLNDYLSNNIQRANDTLEKIQAEATSDGLVIHFHVSPWPLVISQQRVSDLRHLVKTLPDIVVGVLKNYFRSSEEFCEFFASSPDIYKLLTKVNLRSDQLLCRYDVLYNNNELKLLELNVGTNVGGWELDWLHTDTLKAVASVPGLSAKSIVYRPVIPSMINAVAQAVKALDKHRYKGNILFRTATMSATGRMRTAQLLQSHYCSSPSYEKGRIFVACDLDDLKFSSSRQVYYQGQEMDAVLLLDDQMSSEVYMMLNEAYVSGNILFPDSCIHDLIGNKLLMGLLHDPRAREFMDERQTEYIERHLPWSAPAHNETVLWNKREYSPRDLLTENQDAFVLKGAKSWQGRQVFIGKHTHRDKWTDLIRDACTESRWIVQEFCPSDPIYGTDSESRIHEILPVFAGFGCGKSYGGSVARGLPIEADKGVVNLSQGAGVYVLLEDSFIIHKENDQLSPF